MATTESEITEASERFISLCSNLDRTTLPLLGPDTTGAVASPGWTVESLLAEIKLSAEALKAARLIVERQGKDELHLALSAPGEPLLPLRKAPDGPVFDIMTNHGNLSGDLPFFATLADHTTKSRIAQSHQDEPSDQAEPRDIELFLAFDLLDVIVLRSWGLAATLATGFEQLKGARLGRLVDMLHHRDNRQMGVGEAPVDDEQALPRLTFVAWSPGCGSLVKPVGLAALLRQWTELGDLFEFGILDDATWKADADLLRRIRMVIKLEAWPQLAKIAFEHLEENGKCLGFKRQKAATDQW